MKLLLIGPFPPPHGGVSVHVLTLERLLRASGIRCRVLNVDSSAPESDQYIAIRGRVHFIFLLFVYALTNWSFHVHINGHNLKSWLVALAAGLAGFAGPGSMLTVHSGMAPAYLRNRRSGRLLAWGALRFYRRIVAVNSEIKNVLCSLSGPKGRVEVLPAFLPFPPALRELSEELESWSRAHHPIISTALFFRPEYGFELLVQAKSELLEKHPRLGCVVMGDSECRPEGLPPHFIATGDLSHDSCLAVIAHSDVFVRTAFSDGDAISVREALALGTPVVASDVVTRPAGTVCFKAGDVRDLVSKIESLLSGAGPLACAGSEPGGEGFCRLLELYSE